MREKPRQPLSGCVHSSTDAPVHHLPTVGVPAIRAAAPLPDGALVHGDPHVLNPPLVNAALGALAALVQDPAVARPAAFRCMAAIPSLSHLTTSITSVEGSRGNRAKYGKAGGPGKPLLLVVALGA